MILKLNLPKKISRKRLERIKNPKKKLLYLFSFYHDSDNWGLLDIVDGLDYHYKTHRIYERKISRGLSYGHATHEVVAYLNRLGQLYYFFKSEKVHDIFCDNNQCSRKDNCRTNDILNKKIPTLLALIPFRNKYTAHRQQDCPRPDDCKSLGLSEFGLKPNLVGIHSEALKVKEASYEELKELYLKSKIQYFLPTNQRILAGPAVDGVEFISKKNSKKEGNNVIVFSPSEHHQQVIEEIFNMIECCLQCNQSDK